MPLAWNILPSEYLNALQNTDYLCGGRRAKANHTGAFVWGDNTDSEVVSTNANYVTVRVEGGHRLFSNSHMTLGGQLPPKATAWAALSDRNAKENFEELAATQILDGVALVAIQGLCQQLKKKMSAWQRWKSI